MVDQEKRVIFPIDSGTAPAYDSTYSFQTKAFHFHEQQYYSIINPFTEEFRTVRLSPVVNAIWGFAFDPKANLAVSLGSIIDNKNIKLEKNKLISTNKRGFHMLTTDSNGNVKIIGDINEMILNAFILDLDVEQKFAIYSPPNFVKVQSYVDGQLIYRVPIKHNVTSLKYFERNQVIFVTETSELGVFNYITNTERILTKFSPEYSTFRVYGKDFYNTQTRVHYCLLRTRDGIYVVAKTPMVTLHTTYTVLKGLSINELFTITFGE